MLYLLMSVTVWKQTVDLHWFLLLGQYVLTLLYFSALLSNVDIVQAIPSQEKTFKAALQKC